MSFDTYHYADDDDYYDYRAKGKDYSGYQPNPSMTDKQKVNPPKNGSGVAKLTNSLVEEKLIDRIEELEKRLAKLENEQPAQFPPSYGLLGWCTTCKQPVSAGGIHYCPGPRISYTGEEND
jgi:hypothetical protein